MILNWNVAYFPNIAPMDYCRFTARDFAADEYFQRWVHRPDTATNMFWQVWVDQHPDKAYEIRRAREIILELEFQDEHEPDVGRKEEMCNAGTRRPGTRSGSLVSLPAVDACCSGGFLALSGWYRDGNAR